MPQGRRAAPTLEAPRSALVALLAALLGGCNAPGNPPAFAEAAAPLRAASDPWVEQTLASLSTRDKAAQLVVHWTGGEYLAADSPEFDRLAALVDQGIGGLIVSIGMPHSYAAKLNRLQRRARVPLLVTSDLESGPGMRLAGIWAVPAMLPQGGGTSIPSAMAIGATGSEALATAAGRVTGREARAVGIHLTYGPVLDVNSNPRNPIINTRSFGEDPAQVGALAAAWIRGAHSAGLLTTGKHFPGHGDTEADSHIGLPVLTGDRSRLDRLELVPFRAAVAAGTDAMLVGHIAVATVDTSGTLPATLSTRLTDGMLRTDLGFRGLVVTDALNMAGVTRGRTQDEVVVQSVLAGADLLLQPPDPEAAIRALVAAVGRGEITPARLDASVRRVLTAKMAAGLHRRRDVSLEAVDSLVGGREHAAVAREIAERSLTLARDARGLVPVRPGARLLVVTYAGEGDPVAGRTFRAALAEAGYRVVDARVHDRTPPAEWARLSARADSADAIIAAAHVQPREGRGSIGTDVGFSGWVERLAADGKPVIAVSFGSPYLLSSFPSVSAYLLAWSGVDASQWAAARALAGRLPITGRLPVSLPPYHARGDGLQRTPSPR